MMMMLFISTEFRTKLPASIGCEPGRLGTSARPLQSLVTTESYGLYCIASIGIGPNPQPKRRLNGHGSRSKVF